MGYGDPTRFPQAEPIIKSRSFAPLSEASPATVLRKQCGSCSADAEVSAVKLQRVGIDADLELAPAARKRADITAEKAAPVLDADDLLPARGGARVSRAPEALGGASLKRYPAGQTACGRRF